MDSTIVEWLCRAISDVTQLELIIEGAVQARKKVGLLYVSGSDNNVLPVACCEGGVFCVWVNRWLFHTSWLLMCVKR